MKSNLVVIVTIVVLGTLWVSSAQAYQEVRECIVERNIQANPDPWGDPNQVQDVINDGCALPKSDAACSFLDETLDPGTKTFHIEGTYKRTVQECHDEQYEISPAGVNQSHWRCRWQIFYGCGGPFWKEAGWSREPNDQSGCSDYSGWSAGAAMTKTCYPPGTSYSPIPFDVYWDNAVYGTRTVCQNVEQSYGFSQDVTVTREWWNKVERYRCSEPWEEGQGPPTDPQQGGTVSQKYPIKVYKLEDKTTNAYTEAVKTSLEGALNKSGGKDTTYEGLVDDPDSAKAFLDRDNTINQAQTREVFNLAVSGEREVLSCNINREVDVYNSTMLYKVEGDFRLLGINYHTDIQSCQVKRDFQVRTWEEPTDLGTESFVLFSQYSNCFQAECAGFAWGGDEELWLFNEGRGVVGYAQTYVNLDGPLDQELVIRGGFALLTGRDRNDLCQGGEMSRKKEAQWWVEDVDVGDGTMQVVHGTQGEYKETLTCHYFGTITKKELVEVISDGCESLRSSCTFLEDVKDPGCRTFEGEERCAEFWDKKEVYACRQEYDCSIFPDNDEACGSWPSPQKSLDSCQASMDAGLKSIALTRFANVLNQLECEQVTASGISVNLSGTSPFFSGCGRFDQSSQNYRMINREYTGMAGTCLVKEGVWPENLLVVQERSQDSPDGLRLRWKDFDYFTEKIADGCKEMVEDLNRQGVKCEFKRQLDDGVRTWEGGNRLSVKTNPITKVFKGGLGDHSFERPWWELERQYVCWREEIEPETELSPYQFDMTQDTETAPGTDANDFGKALGTLGAVNEIGAAVASGEGCKSGDSPCPYDQITIFAGQDRECKNWDPVNQTKGLDCCKASASFCVDPDGNQNPSCLDYCSDNDRFVSDLLDVKKINYQYIGNKCSQTKCLVPGLGKCLYEICVERKNVYCFFPNDLGLLIQQQGRAQLGIGWGDGEDPDCRGLSMKEFELIDFKKIDFGPWIDAQEMTPRATDTTQQQDQMQEQIENNVNEGEFQGPPDAVQ